MTKEEAEIIWYSGVALIIVYGLTMGIIDYYFTKENGK